VVSIRASPYSTTVGEK